MAFQTYCSSTKASPQHYCPYLSPVSVVSLRQARVVLGLGGRYEDSLRPRRGERGWREFFRTWRETAGLAGEWAAGFKYGCEPPLSNQQLEEVALIGEMHLFWSDSPTSAWKKHYLAVSELLQRVQGPKVQGGSISSLRSHCWPRFLFSGDDWRM